jgi:hypothetical protein
MQQSRDVLYLNIYGVGCLISDLAHTEVARMALQKLKRDFAYFESTVDSSNAPVRVDICASFASDSENWSEVHWPNGPALRFSVERKHRTAVFIEHPEVAAYIENFINSAVGEILERSGWFRLHAAGIAEEGTKLCLWHAPRGSGKSVRTLRQLQAGRKLLAGDEMIFFHNGVAYPFPIPVASIDESRGSIDQRTFVGSTKFLHPIPSERVIAPTADFIIKTVVKFRLQPFALAYWFASVILGLGLPQMGVYLVRKDTFMWLALQAFRRARFAFKLWRDGRVKFITVSELRT